MVMQAAVQKFIDSSVSKTINLPEDISFEAFRDVYLQAYELGCKGCTTYRPNPVTGAVLEARIKTPETAELEPQAMVTPAAPAAEEEVPEALPPPVLGDVRGQAELDLAVVNRQQLAPRRGHEGLADLAALLGAHRDVLQVGIVGPLQPSS